tara:strand:- start:38 stop:202 length:165 start_codon:yes stop_codon:yes gene_type:complete
MWKKKVTNRGFNGYFQGSLTYELQRRMNLRNQITYQEHHMSCFTEEIDLQGTVS